MTFQPTLAGFEELFAPIFPQQNEDLRDFPRVTSDALKIHGKELGRAGELLVESTLLRLGHQSISVGEHLPFDSVVLHPQGLIRIQVKTAARPRNACYNFNVSRGYHRSPTGVRSYANEDFDLLALVALSDNIVKFSADRRRSQSIGLDEIAGLRTRPGETFEAALQDLCSVRDVVSTVSPSAKFY
jgi:hypothetical protein